MSGRPSSHAAAPCTTCSTRDRTAAVCGIHRERSEKSDMCISRMMRYLIHNKKSCEHANHGNPSPQPDRQVDPNRSSTVRRPRRPPPCPCPSPARREPTVRASRRRPLPPPRRCMRLCAVSSGRAGKSCCSSKRSRTASIGAAGGSGPASGRGSK